MSIYKSYETIPSTDPDNYLTLADFEKASKFRNHIVRGILASVTLTYLTVGERLPDSDQLTPLGTGLGIAALGCIAFTGILVDKLRSHDRSTLIPHAPETEEEPLVIQTS